MPGKKSFNTKPAPEKALLAGVEKRDNLVRWPLSESMFELAELARSVGANPVITVTQKIHSSQPTYVGKGKLLEIVGHVKHNQIKIVILDDELHPSQQKILEENLQAKKKPFLQLMISSPGGDVSSCFALIDIMNGSKIPIRTIGLGCVASCGLSI